MVVCFGGKEVEESYFWEGEVILDVVLINVLVEEIEFVGC